MKTTAGKFVLKFGICVIVASLFSGCGSSGPKRTAMIDPDELKWFVVDCSRAAEQVTWLNSLRQSDDDQLFSLAGWNGQAQRLHWLINAHLIRIRERC